MANEPVRNHVSIQWRPDGSGEHEVAVLPDLAEQQTLNTVAAWKVVWREQASSMTAAVCGPFEGRPIIPDHKLMSVPVETDAEADFLCAVLNSQPVAAIVAGYTVSVSISTHVLEHVRIPRYDPANELHCEIAEVGRLAREMGASDEAALERLVSRLWSPS